MCCDPDPVRRRYKVTGIVQGVGFRPFIFRIAKKSDLSGFVINNVTGVQIEVEGEESDVNIFEKEIRDLAPPLAHIISVESKGIPLIGGAAFEIRKSDDDGAVTAYPSPDADVCDGCLQELFDKTDRRFRHPFITCVNCGPRYTIIEKIPYDRPNTSMTRFPMCANCQSEYDDINDRRHHAQPVACHECGPTLTLRDENFSSIECADQIKATVKLLEEGSVVAIKGIGGYHLACVAENAKAVSRLRGAKNRDSKPFAIMVKDSVTAKKLVVVDENSKGLLDSRPHPIVLLDKVSDDLLPGVAPGAKSFGVMTPYTPLHHLLFADGKFDALVMTSANISDEPIVYEDQEAGQRLKGIADYYLTHDRPIVTGADDSIEKYFGHGPMVMRRSRGYVPTPIMLDRSYPTILSVGAELKNTYCVIKDNKAFVGPHVGDLKYSSVYDSYKEGIFRFLELLGVKQVSAIGHDLHPSYLSTMYANEQPENVKKVGVQHHHAHLVSLMAEHGLNEDIIGVVFDGTGYGDDGGIWGGEFLVGGIGRYERRGTVSPLHLPGGDAAIKEPYRIALGILKNLYGESIPDLPIEWLRELDENKFATISTMIAKKINTPVSHGVGRHFDAMAALLGLHSKVSFEGEAAMGLEWIVAEHDENVYHSKIELREDLYVLDLLPVYRAAIGELAAKIMKPSIAARFHNSIIHGVAEMVKKISLETKIRKVGLSGGVFQNKYLSDRLAMRLSDEGYQLFLHSRIPPNDGGISLGQALVTGATI